MKETTIYEVQCFVNVNGTVTDKETEQTVMICQDIDRGSGSMPFSVRIARSMDLKVGDKFTETCTYAKEK